jgi:DNA-binding transcriptional LysR family regulator
VLLRDRKRPLKSPQDLRHHVLLHFDEPHRPTPWLTWNVWLESAGVPDLEPADSLRFNHYDQTIGAALGGQGVALGRRPLVRKLLADGALVAPFPLGSVTDRAYFIVRTALTSGRPEVNHFVEWLIAEAAATTARDGDGAVSKRKSRRRNN